MPLNFSFHSIGTTKGSPSQLIILVFLLLSGYSCPGLREELEEEGQLGAPDYEFDLIHLR